MPFRNMHGPSPGSAGSPTLDPGPFRPDAMDVNANMQGISGPDPTELMDIINAVPRRSDHHSLQKWYTDNDGPWVPDGVAVPQRNNSLAFGGSAAHSRFLGVSRSGAASAGAGAGGLPATFRFYQAAPVAPSECSTVPTGVGRVLPSDSGYHSHGHGRSIIDDPSVYGGGDQDRSAETQSLVGQLEEWQVMQSVSPSALMQNADPGHHRMSRSLWSHAGDLSSTTTQAAEPEHRYLVCEDCKHPCKTPSELKKHKARHTKPHTCPVPNCTRTRGFSTLNDLERHKRSRHPNTDAVGSRYRCHIGPCASKNKLWPRADNFRQHLRRIHKDLAVDIELEQFMDRVPQLPNNDLAGLGSGDHVHLDVSMAGVGPDPRMMAPLGWRAPGPLPDGQHERSHVQDVSQVQRVVDSAFTEDANLMVGGQFADDISSESNSQDRDAADADSRSASPTPEPAGLDPSEDSGMAVLMETDEAEPPTVQIQDHCVQPDVLSFQAPVSADKVPGCVPVEPETTQPDRGIDLPDAEDDLTRDEDMPGSTGRSDDHEEDDDESDEDGEDDDDEPSDSSVSSAPMQFDAPDNPVSVVDPRVIAPEPMAPAPKESLKLSLTPQPEGASSTDSGGPTPLSTSSSVEEADAPGDDDDNDEDDASKASALLKSLQAKGMLEKLIGELGYQKAKPQSAKARKPIPGQIPSGEAAQLVKCNAEDCNKTFNRQCELKKHMKRHDKPYGCTYSKCVKKFGSKSDWKRHENSQHHKMEVWRCDEPLGQLGDGNTGSSSGGIGGDSLCGKVCWRRETFKLHLQREHGVRNEADLSARIEKYRDAGHCDTRYWCGFCMRVIEIEPKDGGGTSSSTSSSGSPAAAGSGPGSAWHERFDHIDDHLFGRNNLPRRKISEWKHSSDQDAPAVKAASSSSTEPSSSSASTSAKASTPGASSSSNSQASLSLSSPGGRSGGSRSSSPEHSLSGEKRAGEDLLGHHHSHHQRSKRPRVDTRKEVFWTCCQCHDYNQLQLTGGMCTASGMSCSHQRCADCTTENNEVNEDN